MSSAAYFGLISPLLMGHTLYLYHLAAWFNFVYELELELELKLSQIAQKSVLKAKWACVYKTQ
jgi:hypothetical protein